MTCLAKGGVTHTIVNAWASTTRQAFLVIRLVTVLMYYENTLASAFQAVQSLSIRRCADNINTDGHSDKHSGVGDVADCVSDNGFTANGTASGDDKYQIECLESAQFSEPVSSCRPDSCNCCQ